MGVGVKGNEEIQIPFVWENGKLVIDKNIKLKATHEKEFLNIFNVPLSRFMHPIFGFDIIQFDTYIRTPDGTSTKEWAKKRYGVESVGLLYKLMGSKRRK